MAITGEEIRATASELREEGVAPALFQIDLAYMLDKSAELMARLVEINDGEDALRLITMDLMLALTIGIRIGRKQALTEFGTNDDNKAE